MVKANPVGHVVCDSYWYSVIVDRCEILCCERMQRGRGKSFFDRMAGWAGFGNQFYVLITFYVCVSRDIPMLVGGLRLLVFGLVGAEWCEASHPT